MASAPVWRQRPAVSSSSGAAPRAARSSRRKRVAGRQPPGLESSKPPDASFRFRRHNRLLNAAAFGRVFRSATRSRDRCFTVLCRDNGGPEARLGLAISKKHCRKSTSRNTIKRIVRESFRQHQARLAGLDVVVINQPAASTASRRQLFDSLAGHWRRCSRKSSATGGQE